MEATPMAVEEEATDDTPKTKDNPNMRGPRGLTDDVKMLFMENLEKLGNVPEAARLGGISPVTGYKLRKEFGLEAKFSRKRGPHLTEDVKRAIAAEYHAGGNAIAIAKKFNVHRDTVTRVSRKFPPSKHTSEEAPPMEKPIKKYPLSIVTEDETSELRARVSQLLVELEALKRERDRYKKALKATLEDE
jgi:transposase-like protein